MEQDMLSLWLKEVSFSDKVAVLEQSVQLLRLVHVCQAEFNLDVKSMRIGTGRRKDLATKRA